MSTTSLPAAPTTCFHGRPVTLQALGQTWTFARWEIDKLDAWTDWARRHLPDPLVKVTEQIERMMTQEEERTAAARTDAEKQALQVWLARRNRIKDELVNAAVKQAGCYLDFLSSEVQSLLRSLRGLAHLTLLLLRDAHPNVTEEQAFALVAELGQVRIQEVLSATMGYAPPASSPEGNALPPAATS